MFIIVKVNKCKNYWVRKKSWTAAMLFFNIYYLARFWSINYELVKYLL